MNTNAAHPPSASARLGEAELWDTLAEAIRPRHRMSSFEFGRDHRHFGKEGRSARWRPSDTPWAKGILDALDEGSPYQEVYVPKGTQLGLTEIGLIWTGKSILRGQSTLFFEPSESVAKKIVRTKFRPMLKSATILSGIFTGRSADTTLHFSSPTVDVIFAGSNSPTNFASVTAPHVVADEFDRWQLETDDEGDSLETVKNRYADYGFLGKLFVPCSPTLESRGIWPEYLTTDQRKFHCPCPACGHKQAWEWDDLRLAEEGKPSSIVLVCRECGGAGSETDWKAHWQDGEWLPTAKPQREDAVGFHISSLYGRLGGRTWAALWARHEAVVKSAATSKMQVFYNTILGLPWKVTEDAVPAQSLRERLEHQHIRGVIPAGGLALFAGCDYQKNRVEVFVWAFARGRERWLVDKVVVERLRRDGSQRPSGDVAADLKALALEKVWPHQLGGSLTVEHSVHDSGDHPADVFDILEHFSSSKACASKGTDGWGQPMLYRAPKIVDVKRDGKVVLHGRRLMWINTAPAKTAWYEDLRMSAQPEGPSERFVHLPGWIDEEEGLLEQHVAEEVRKTKRGKLKWEKVFERNEGLDCAIMADAARWQTKSHRWSEREWLRREALVSTTNNEPPPAPDEPNEPTEGSTGAGGGWIPTSGRAWIRR